MPGNRSTPMGQFETTDSKFKHNSQDEEVEELVDISDQVSHRSYMSVSSDLNNAVLANSSYNMLESQLHAQLKGASELHKFTIPFIRKNTEEIKDDTANYETDNE